MGDMAPAADLDFSTSTPAADMMERGIKALGGMSDMVIGMGLPAQLEELWPLWQSRPDAQLGDGFVQKARHGIGSADAPGDALPVKLSYHGGLTESHSGDTFSLIRFGLAVWQKDLKRATLATFIDVAVGASFPTIPIMGMRVQAPRSMLKAIRRMCFHEVDYQPWLAAHCDFAKQQRRMERLVKLSLLEDFKTMGGRSRGTPAFYGLQLRWKRVREMLILADWQGLRERAKQSPPQLTFFMRVCARSCFQAQQQDTMAEYGAWLLNTVLPELDIVGEGSEPKGKRLKSRIASLLKMLKNGNQGNPCQRKAMKRKGEHGILLFLLSFSSFWQERASKGKMSEEPFCN